MTPRFSPKCWRAGLAWPCPSACPRLPSVQAQMRSGTQRRVTGHSHRGLQMQGRVRLCIRLFIETQNLQRDRALKRARPPPIQPSTHPARQFIHEVRTPGTGAAFMFMAGLADILSSWACRVTRSKFEGNWLCTGSVGLDWAGSEAGCVSGLKDYSSHSLLSFPVRVPAEVVTSEPQRLSPECGAAPCPRATPLGLGRTLSLL